MPSPDEILFASALALPPAERAAFLAQACGHDAALRARVEELLRADEQAKSFLEAPAGGTMVRPAAHDDQVGKQIGRYKLLQKIGEGGCGVVYMSEQEEPVRRRVALKVIKLGMDTREVIARFEAERQALALMDHPNIARVFDGGATETGRPYFVMELVRGVPITRYCDEAKLPARTRLELFIQVCHAVQHAHQKGIIHRDLKPSNVLVTINDGVAVPKVIDFGIAKATQGRLTDATLFTAFEQFIGTPAYMSPEQAEMTSLDVDTRSDVYSLGVLLYELLTGMPPFDPKTLVAAGLDEIRRVIREVEPPRPSARISTLPGADQTTTANLRQIEVPKLVNLLRGDLDWIVMRCLEKDRARRYGTATSLAQDLQHHLDNEPVNARPPSALYRLQKLVARNRLAVGAAAAVSAALLLGTGASTWRYFKEKTARLQAVAAEQKTQTEARKSAQVAQFLQDMLAGVGPAVALGRDTTLLREVLDKTADRIGHDLKTQPEVEAELRQTLGSVYRELGEPEKAEAMFRRALQLRQASLSPDDSAVAVSLLNLARILGERGDLAGAEKLFAEARATRDRLAADALAAKVNASDPLAATSQMHRFLATFQAVQQQLLEARRTTGSHDEASVAKSLNSLGGVALLRGELDEAESSLSEALAMQRQSLGPEHPDIAITLMNLGALSFSRGDYAAAEKTWREALALQRKLLGPEHPNIAQLLMNLGALSFTRGDFAQAESIWRETLAMQRRLLGDEHPDTVMSVMNLGALAFARGHHAEATQTFRQVLAMHRKLFGDQSLYVAGSLGNLGEALAATGESTEAEAAYREALAIRRKLFGDQSTEVAEILGGLGELYQGRNQWVEAESFQRDALAIWAKANPEDWQGFNLRCQLGVSLLGQGKRAEAESWLVAGCEGLLAGQDKIRSDSQARYLPRALTQLVRFYREQGHEAKAAEWQQRFDAWKRTAEQPRSPAPNHSL